MTGIGYNKPSVAKAGMPPLTKLAQLWDNKLADHVTFLTEMRDTFGLGMLKLGLNPSKATLDDVNKVVADMQPLVSNNGLRFTGNSYLQDFASGKVWAAMVWSGDLASSGSADDTFVFPQEGAQFLDGRANQCDPAIGLQSGRQQRPGKRAVLAQSE